MSATTITKRCAINIDRSLGLSAGERSACWVYLKGLDGKLLGQEGAAYILTHDGQLKPMWQVIEYSGATLERHKQLYKMQRKYMSGLMRKLIKQALEADLTSDDKCSEVVATSQTSSSSPCP